MSNDSFCIESTVTDIRDKLMPLEGFFSSKSQWTYFDGYEALPKTKSNLNKIYYFG